MKLLHLTTLSLLVAACSVLAAPSRTVGKRVKRQSTSPPGFIQSRNGRFEVDGKPFYFVGTNAYWLHQLNSLDDITKTLTDIAARGIKVVRTWGFNDVVGTPPAKGAYFQLWQNGTATINEGPNGLQRLDHIVKTAEQLGIYIQLVLSNNWTPVRTDDPNRVRGKASNDYGGIDTYVQQLVPGGTHDEFFTNDKIKTAYKNYIRTIISRYKDSKAIFSWELVNDPRCKPAQGHSTSGNCNAQTITKFTAEISSFIKKDLDSNHMASSGDGGFYCLDCTKLYANNPPPPPSVSQTPSKKRNAKDIPMWKRIKKNGPWTKRAMLAKLVHDEKLRAIASRQPAKSVAARIRGRWGAPAAASYPYKYRYKRQDGSDTDFGPGYDGTYQVDHDDLMAVPDVDFSTFQYFPDQFTYSGMTESTDATDTNLSLQDKITQGVNWIEAHAESSNTYNKPTTLTGVGLVSDDSNSYTPFSSSDSNPDTQQQYASDDDQKQAYTSLFDSVLQNDVNGVTQYSWGQTGLSSVPGTAVDDSNSSGPDTQSANGYSPDDGYAAYNDSLKDVLQQTADQIEQKYGSDSG